MRLIHNLKNETLQLHTHTHTHRTHTHTQLFYGPFSGTTQVSWYQKKILLLDFMV